MISGISATSASLRTAFARYDRAAAAVVESADAAAATGVSDPSELAAAIVALMTEQLAVRAALEVARTSNEMVSDAIRDL